MNMKKNTNKIILALMLIIIILPLTMALTARIGNSRTILTVQLNQTGNTVVDRTIFVENVNDVPVNVTLTPSVELSGITSVIDSDYILQIGENKSSRFKITLNQPGDYDGLLNVEFKDDQGHAVSLSSHITIHASYANSTSNNNTTGGNPLPTPGTSKVAYIIKSASDASVLATIRDAGYTVDVIPSTQLSSVNFSNYQMIVLGNEKFTSTEVAKIPVNSRPSMLLNTENLDDFGWTSASITPKTSSGRPRAIPVYNTTISISQGVPSSFMPYIDHGVSTYNLFYLDNRDKAPGIKIIVADSLISAIGGMKPQNGGVVSVVEKNITLRNSQISQSRGVFFGITPGQYWTEDTKTLFKNSLIWALRGEDADHDGFYSDLDCNDSPSGGANIHPGATEIPYNGIDEDCVNGDLNDRDNDGFIGVQALNGNDCNDLDASINPGVNDPLKNCINDPPVFNGPIPTQVWLEDQVKVVNLNDYFSDPDGASLTFDVAETSNENNLMLVINGNLAIFTPRENWNGQDYISFRASDGNRNITSNRFNLQVTGVNDAPTVQNISEVKVVEGGLAHVVINATDIDGDTLTISYSNKFNSLGEWQTHQGDAGLYTVNAIVSDGVTSTTKSFNVDVIGKIYVNEFSTSGNWVELYNPVNHEIDLSGFTLEDNSGVRKQLSGKIPANGFFVAENLGFNLGNEDSIVLKLNDQEVNRIDYGGSSIILKPENGKSSGRDPDGSDNWIIFEHPTKGLASNADVIPPTVELISPNDSAIFTESRDVTFEFKAVDNRNNLECGIFSNLNGNFNYLNPKHVENDTVSSINLLGIADGSYLWNVRCTDGVSTSFAENRSFVVSAPDAPTILPVGNKEVRENQTIQFIVSATDQDNDAVVLSASDLPNNASFNNGNFSWVPDFDQQGEHKVRFTATDSTNRTSSQEISINVVDVEQPPKFSDAETCDSVNNSIKVTISDPKANDKFELGETIDVKVKIKNSGKEDADLDVNAYLYDITSDNSVKDDGSSISVNKGDTETVEFSLTVPENTDDTDKFAIYVNAQESPTEFCNSNFVKIVIERPKDKLEIKNVLVSPDTPRRGDRVDLRVDVRNIGSKSQNDVYVTVDNSDLGLHLRSDTFKLERFDKDDSQAVDLHFTLPDDVEEADYPLTVQAHFGGGVENKIVDLYTLSSSAPVNSNTNLAYNTGTSSGSGNSNVDSGVVYVDKNAKPVTTTKTTTVPVRQTTYKSVQMSDGDLMGSIVWIIDAILIIGIVIILILVIITVSRKPKRRMMMGKIMKFEKEEE